MAEAIDLTEDVLTPADLRAKPLDHLPTVLSRADFDKHASSLAEDAALANGGSLLQAMFSLLVAQADRDKAVKGKGGGKRKKVTAAAARKSGPGTWVSGTGYGGSDASDKKMHANTLAAKAREQSGDAAVALALAALCADLEAAIARAERPTGAGLGAALQMPLSDLEKLMRRRPGTNKRTRLAHATQTDLTVLSTLRSYWRNDSSTDVEGRLNLYEALMNFTEVLAGSPVHTGLLGLLVLEPRDDDERDDDDDDDDNEEEGEANSEAGGSPATPTMRVRARNTVLVSLHQLAAQAKLLSRSSGSTVSSSSASSAAAGADFFRRLQQASARADAALAAAPFYRELAAASAPVTRSERRSLLQTGAFSALDEAALRALYAESMEDIRFRSVALLDLARHNLNGVHYQFDKEAAAVQTAAGSNRVRMARIGREISTLATGLPVQWESGIFVRADEDRPDVLSAMIIGPEDSPYANGAFIFDVFLPAQYPQVPPKVILKTTGGGSVRFNPNLYNCGKVCLSLLGTWAGPGWVPNESTLLQVLVSIQSLILVADPYFNEPGFEASMHTPRGKQLSQHYNEIIRRGTLAHAILAHLRSPPYLFKDVLETHFAIKRAVIEKQCADWAAEAKTRTAAGAACASDFPPSFATVAGRVQQQGLGALAQAIPAELSKVAAEKQKRREASTEAAPDAVELDGGDDDGPVELDDDDDEGPIELA